MKSRMEIEMGNVSKKQQTDKRAEHSRSPTMGLQHNKKIFLLV